MTREEEIKLVADCHIADSIENYKEFYEGFIHGAKWADKCPNEEFIKGIINYFTPILKVHYNDEYVQDLINEFINSVVNELCREKKK